MKNVLSPKIIRQINFFVISLVKRYFHDIFAKYVYLKNCKLIWPKIRNFFTVHCHCGKVLENVKLITVTFFTKNVNLTGKMLNFP